MPAAAYAFLLSFSGMVALGVLKHFDFRANQPGFLSRFDAPLGAALQRLESFTHRLALSLRARASSLVRESGHSLISHLHAFLRSAERRAERWREFGRERKIERKPASSAFIKDVFEYKNQIHQNGDNHQL